MLMAIREKVSGWLGWAVVALIIVAFSLFGIDYYIQESSRAFAAKVNGEEISLADFERAYQQRRQQVRRELGEDYNPDTFDDNAVREATLDSLINNELLFQAANRAGFAISDSLLAARIQSNTVFHEDGRFSPERYRELLSRRFLEPLQYEQQVRRDMLTSQVASSVVDTATIPVPVMDRLIGIQGQTRKIEYFVVPAGQFVADVEISEDEVAAFYEQNRNLFMDPEQVRLAYVELNADSYADDIPVDDAEIQRLYEERAEQLGASEERRARHILIAITDQVDEDAARKKAEAALARVRAGEDFAAVARELSDDPGSRENGGDLGFFSRGLMVAEFDDAVFGMEEGEISEVIRTDFGFHVVQLLDIKPAEIPPLEELREALSLEARRDQMLDRYLDDVETLSNLAFENPDSLDAVVETLGLQVKTTDWVARTGSGEGVASNRKVMTAAFSDDVLLRGNNSEVVELADNRAVVVRVQEHRDARSQPLEAVAQAIRDRLTAQQSSSMARDRSAELVTRLKGGAAIADLAAEAGAELASPGVIGRDAGKEMDVAIVRHAFRLPRPAQETSAGTVRTTAGDYAVVQVLEVHTPDLKTYAVNERDAIQRNLAQLMGEMDSRALLKALRESAEIEKGEIGDS